MVAYFLQVNVCWLLFYGVYYALLSKETFFRLNRTWLIISLLCGLALPFVADYFAVKVVPTNLFVMTLEPFVVSATALQRNLAADTEGGILKVLATVYGLGVAVLAVRFLAGLFLIFKLFWQSEKEKKEGFTLVITEGEVSPFSFFNFIFINPNNYETYDFQQIMQHENAHVRQKHSLDVVFLELLNIVFWCSPLIYFYKTSLRNVHEYLADEAVLRQNAKSQYGRLLLRQRQSGVALSLTSNISNHFFSQLKKRILMMTRNKSKRTALIKYALAAPIFLILTAALASPKMPILAKTEALGEKVVTTIDKIEKENLNSLLVQIVDNQQIITADTSNMKEGEIMVYLDNLRTGGKVSESEIRKAKALMVTQIVNGKSVECAVTSFVMVRVPHRDDPIQVNCQGNTNDAVKRVLSLAKAGDMIQFFQIRAQVKDFPQPRDVGSISFLVTQTPPQYSAVSDTTFKPLTDLKLLDANQIQRMDIDSKEEWNTIITITLKDGRVEYYKGSKEDIGKILTVGSSGAHINQTIVAEEKPSVQNNNEDKIFTIVEQNPEFVGGMSALFKWLGENIKYPKSARDAGAQGTVYVGFVVETDGSITNAVVKRDVPVIVRDTITITEVNGIKGNKIVERTEYSLGKEAIRVISMMPNWKPGRQQGKPVRVAYTLPIKFKLE